MTNFLDGLEQQLNDTQTWNGALAHKSTLNSNLDLFGKIGSTRNNIQLAVTLFNAAYKEDPETATRILFYARDIRGGQGERSVFKAILKELAITDSRIAAKLISLVPIFGRWDDLLVLEETSLWSDVLNLYASQLETDTILLLQNDKSISLLGKWLPSINASSKDSKRQAKKIAKFLEMSDKEYRTLLVSLRTKIKIVEQSMCSNDWQDINYEHVPSKASNMYRKAFLKHDEDRYTQYIEDVQKGDKKINAATLYPYDICSSLTSMYGNFKETMNQTERKALDAQWKALPDYLDGREYNCLVLPDVSGSMYYGSGKVKPINVAVSLATYIADKNKGAWKDVFLAFDSEPRLAKLSGNDIFAKLQSVALSTTHMGTTNLIGAIQAILDSGTKNKLSAEEMPQSLIIISDMQFDRSCRSNKRTNFEQMQKLYSKAGYTMPNVIFWNVNSADNVPITFHDTGTALVSGCSPSILRAILNSRFLTPVDLMKEAVYTERYDVLGSLFK